MSLRTFQDALLALARIESMAEELVSALDPRVTASEVTEGIPYDLPDGGIGLWNPLQSDSQALQLAVRHGFPLDMDIVWMCDEDEWAKAPQLETRKAIALTVLQSNGYPDIAIADLVDEPLSSAAAPESKIASLKASAPPLSTYKLPLPHLQYVVLQDKEGNTNGICYGQRLSYSLQPGSYDMYPGKTIANVLNEIIKRVDVSGPPMDDFDKGFESGILHALEAIQHVKAAFEQSPT